MIRITIFKDKLGHIERYYISGHAGYDIKGKDIVCAAVSILAQTTLMSLVEVCGVAEDEITYAIDGDKGIVDVTLPEHIEPSIRLKTETVLRTMELGIKSILEIYPEYVTLKYREV
ncbi:ribosomal-processing cysteine protease Prp [Tepidimicrobium xylanilyticum]|uniref:ribosomal-processing cysteine protease Prp n=1 Tax=Tepidimicrobium xylanilyticum TaxID=1123352 RepID=UPI00264C2126|nr:ribosomal-processing cysteine protease Prp [Tepidimicrobium xylanilyticum]GMG97246.1 hypothetical protein EN5CB1_20720 [Tepidimicrobium xylanilyticum]